ncbi:MAG: insulinase family protein [Ignavibacteriaceae bacterium]|nr:insulinase family protein [Ignavibacteriaceae bacterium]
MKNLFLVLISLGFLVTTQAQKETPPAGSTPKDFSLPVEESFTLSNGIGVTFIKFGEIPKVSINIYIAAGKYFEKKGETLISSMAADMLIEGTKSRSNEVLAGQASSYGADLVSGSGNDLAYLATDAISDFTPQVIELLADCLINPAHDEKTFERIKGDYQRNINISNTTPQIVVDEEFKWLFFGDTPYGRKNPQSVESFKVNQVISYYKENYGPANTYIYIAGNFDFAKAKDALEKHFGSWKTDAVTNKYETTAFSNKKQTKVLNKSGASQSTIMLGIPSPGPLDPDAPAFEVMNLLLGGFFSSRITSNIREDKGYTYSPGSFISNRFQKSYWVFQADVTTNVTGPAINEVFYEIEKMRTEAPTEKELAGLKNYATGIYILQNSSRGGIISKLNSIRYQNLPKTNLTEYLKRINSVTVEDVKNVAIKYLHIDKMTSVILGDEEIIMPQLEETSILE